MLFSTDGTEAWPDGAVVSRAAARYRAAAARILGPSPWRLEAAACVEPAEAGHPRILVTEEDAGEDEALARVRRSVFLARTGREPGECDVLVILPESAALLADDESALLKCALIDLGTLASRWASGSSGEGPEEEAATPHLLRLAGWGLAAGTAWDGCSAAAARRASALAGAACGRIAEDVLGFGEGAEMLARAWPASAVLCELVAREAYMRGVGERPCPDWLSREASVVLEGCRAAVA